jgi:very-short-patch-repair endonuclease
MSKLTPVYPIFFIPSFPNSKDLSPHIKPSGSGNAAVGASEERFGEVLRHYFGDWVMAQQEMLPPDHERPYTADFVIVEPSTGLHVDIEVDESHSFATSEPTHCIGDDDYRNKCFVNAEWVVIRFAEEQVVSQPARCCRFIANVLAKVTGNASLKSQFEDIPSVTPIQQWSRKRAISLKKKKYRQEYLSPMEYEKTAL